MVFSQKKSREISWLPFNANGQQLGNPKDANGGVDEVQGQA